MLRRHRHDCPTPGFALRIGEYWKCSCGRWWAVADVDGSEHGAWFAVGRTHLTAKREIADVLRTQGDLTLIARDDVRRAENTGGPR